MPSVDNIGKDLLKLKAEIDKAKTERDQIAGALKEKFKQLEAFGVKTVEEAEKLLAKQKEELAALEVDITTKYEQLKVDFQW